MNPPEVLRWCEILGAMVGAPERCAYHAGKTGCRQYAATVLRDKKRAKCTAEVYPRKKKQDAKT